MSESACYWEVVENYEAEREEFLSVRAGQVVEVLDDSRSSWMVLTIPMAAEDLQEEGFLPAHILRPAGKYTVIMKALKHKTLSAEFIPHVYT